MIAEKIAALFTSGVETSGEPDSVFPTINAVDTSLRQQAQTQTGGWVMAFHQTYDSELIYSTKVLKDGQYRRREC